MQMIDAEAKNNDSMKLIKTTMLVSKIGKSQFENEQTYESKRNKINRKHCRCEKGRNQLACLEIRRQVRKHIL